MDVDEHLRLLFGQIFFRVAGRTDQDAAIVLVILIPLADGQDVQFSVGQHQVSVCAGQRGVISRSAEKNGKKTCLDRARREKCRVD